MDETAHKIEAHIDRTRERLGSHLRELEHKVEAATDWREQFRARPHLFLGGAIAGGVLLAAVLRPSSSRDVFDSSNESNLASVSRNGVNAQEQALELWNNVKGALIAVAAMRVTEYISELIPGFDEHYRRAAQGREVPRS
ncbi:MAG TPA: hypothetical protein VFS23_39050 [Vicinamibacterales bacterium]|nr:hypothetical protein [Vicinamibacterales bacterium]